MKPWLVTIICFWTCIGCKKPAPVASAVTYRTPVDLARMPLGTPSKKFWEIAKSVSCQMGSGKGPIGGYLTNVDCEDGTRLETVWDAKSCLKEIKLVWEARATGGTR